MPNSSEIRYFVLTDSAVPYLLARVRWPDVAQATSAALPDWLDDRGLFDLPYDRSSVAISFEQAVSVAAGWGRQLSAEPADHVPSYIRRIPANWSDLSPSERRAWGLENVGRRRIPARHRAVVKHEYDRSADERRHDVRVLLGGRAHIRLDHSTISAGLVDFSTSGLGCVLPEGLGLGDWGREVAGPLLLEVESKAARLCLDVATRISWYRRSGEGTHFGISFTKLTADEQRGVRRVLGVPASNRTKVVA
jgi:hypothetical protein